MKTYLKNSMQGMQQMMICMEWPNDGYAEHVQMMGMQGMCHMMSMQGMYHMMDMQGMIPDDGYAGNESYDGYAGHEPYDEDNNMQFPIPMLVKLEQLSPNQIQISYDRDVDIRLGMKPTNYWIKIQ